MVNSLVYMATWRCNNYGRAGVNPRCPYCTLGHNGQSLTIDGKPTSAAAPCDPQDVVDFCLRNSDYFGRRLSISGGEPFMCPTLDDVIQRVAGAGWLWAITSNCVLLPAIERLIGKLSDLNTCAAWTASYHHYAANDEAFFEGLRIIRAARPRHLACTIVLNERSSWIAAELAANVVERVDRVQFQIDFNSPNVATIAARVARLCPQIPIVADGSRAAGWLCDRYGKHFVIAPDGGVFECLTKAYRSLDRIGDARSVVVERLPQLRTRCGLVCDLPCDHVKHLRPPT